MRFCNADIHDKSIIIKFIKSKFESDLNMKYEIEYRISIEVFDDEKYV